MNRVGSQVCLLVLSSLSVSLLCVCLHCTVSSAYTSSLTVGPLAPFKSCVSHSCIVRTCVDRNSTIWFFVFILFHKKIAKRCKPLRVWLTPMPLSGDATRICSPEIKVWSHFGTSVNQRSCWRKLARKSAAHARLLDRIPVVADSQTAWLLLPFCAITKTKFLLRTVSREFTRDAQMWRCFRSVLG